MTRPHEEFEMLAALAAVNQLSDGEYPALEEHLESCASCRLHLAQMQAASHTWFSHHNTRQKKYGLPAEVSERFSRRLSSLGISPNSPANPVDSLRVAVAALTLAIATFGVVGLATHHHRSSSAPTEMAAEQPHSQPLAGDNVFTRSRGPEVHARHKRPRPSEPARLTDPQTTNSYVAEEHLPSFRYTEVSRRLYPETFVVPPVRRFPVIEFGKGLNGAKTFELASLPAVEQSGTSGIANALRFVPQSDLRHPESVAAEPRFNLPPLTDGLLLLTNTHH